MSVFAIFPESVQKIVNKVAGSKLKTKLSKIPKIQQAYWFLNSPNYSRPKIDPDLIATTMHIFLSSSCKTYTCPGIQRKLGV